jgi:hypothetical protein
LTVDGSKTRIETGPRSAGGGFELVVLMRDDGGIIRALEVDGRALSDGTLLLSAENKTADRSFEVRTTR